MTEIFQFPFMQRALIAGAILAILLSLLGIFVVLRRMAFFSDGIAHASLAGVALGVALAVNPLLIALAVSVFFAVVIYFIEKNIRLASDTAIGIIFTSGMALGVIIMSLQPGYQPELMSFLFGNILSISASELWFLLIIGIAVTTFLAVAFRSLTLFALDEDMAYLSGVRTAWLQLTLYIVLTVAVVLGIKILGVVLVSALVIIPTATSRMLATSFKQLVIWSVVIAEFTVASGIILSYEIDIPTGPTIVLTGTLFFIIGALLSRLSGKAR